MEELLLERIRLLEEQMRALMERLARLETSN
jgi:hypothetical protein